MKRRWIIPCLILCVLLLADLAALISLRSRIPHPEKRWQGQDPVSYRYISAYFETPVSGDLLLQTDLQDSRALVAWGGFSEKSLTYGRRSTEISALEVNWDFFQLQTCRTISGSLYYFGRDEEQLVLTKSLAWTLFGSMNCVGESVWVDGVAHVVLAVVEENRGYETNGAYLPADNETQVSFLETVLPEEVEGYAQELFSQLPQAAASLQVDQNARWSVSALAKTAWQRLVQQKQTRFSLPLWEEYAQQTENQISFSAFLLLQKLLALGIFAGAQLFCKRRKRNGTKT